MWRHLQVERWCLNLEECVVELIQIIHSGVLSKLCQIIVWFLLESPDHSNCYLHLFVEGKIYYSLKGLVLTELVCCMVMFLLPVLFQTRTFVLHIWKLIIYCPRLKQGSIISLWVHLDNTEWLEAKISSFYGCKINVRGSSFSLHVKLYINFLALAEL